MAVTLVTLIMILAGLAGVVVPVLPGLLLVWGGVAVWSVARHDATGWAVLGIATVLTLAGSVVKYALPGRRLRAGGVGLPTLATGGLLGVAGFFLVPVVGLPLGFVLGVYLAERVRLSSSPEPGPTAWASTRAALAAVGWSLAIELATALLVATTWAVAALLV